MKRRVVSFFDKASGAISDKRFAGDPSFVELNTPSGHEAIDGEHDHLSKRFDLETKKVVDYQPPQPSQDHEWNATTKRWQLKAEVQQKQAARASALTRIAQLDSESIGLMRQLLLGNASVKDRLVAISHEVSKLKADI